MTVTRINAIAARNRLSRPKTNSKRYRNLGYSSTTFRQSQSNIYSNLNHIFDSMALSGDDDFVHG